MKQIFVQAQPDHIESLFKAAPISALEELIWNALDAKATEVMVDVVTNELHGINAIRVTDNGTGIDVLKADQTFGNLGGSWKRGQAELHGRHGRGRFKAFALGAFVEWRTTMRAGGELLSYVLSGEAAKPGVFELNAATPGPGTGTEVYITGISANADSLFNSTETIEGLASKFALYLKSYPNVRIWFNGLPVTPLIVQRSANTYELAPECKLEVIEWKRKFVGAGRLVWTGRDGFQLFEQAANVRSGGVPFTAYLISDRFKALAAENALIMDELNPEVDKYLTLARTQLKEHFAATMEEHQNERVNEWISEFNALPKKLREAILTRLTSKE